MYSISQPRGSTREDPYSRAQHAHNQADHERSMAFENRERLTVYEQVEQNRLADVPVKVGECRSLIEWYSQEITTLETTINQAGVRDPAADDALKVQLREYKEQQRYEIDRLEQLERTEREVTPRPSTTVNPDPHAVQAPPQPLQDFQTPNSRHLFGFFKRKNKP